MKRSKLGDEIRKTGPFASLEQEAFLNLQRTAGVLAEQMSEALKGAKLSPTQYNVLRILRGAGDEGLACQEIAARMITRDPDMTRLLARLESMRLISRKKGSKDQRVICSRVTAKGLKMLRGLDRGVMSAHEKQLGHLGKQKLRTLVDLLEAARGASDGRATFGRKT